jgi:hypothetical protein
MRRLSSGVRRCGRAKHARAECMNDREHFPAWVKPTLYQADRALHNGDVAPRRALWSRNDPVSVLGAWRNAHGQHELDELFTSLAGSFSDCTSYVFDPQAYDVVGDMAYTAALEHTSASVNGQPRSYTLRHAGVPTRGGLVESRPPPLRHRDRLTEALDGELVAVDRNGKPSRPRLCR